MHRARHWQLGGCAARRQERHHSSLFAHPWTPSGNSRLRALSTADGTHLHGIKGEEGECQALAGGVILCVQRAPALRQIQLQLRLGGRGGDEEANPASGEWGERRVSNTARAEDQHTSMRFDVRRMPSQAPLQLEPLQPGWRRSSWP